MKTADLDFPYPEELVATSPSRPTRVMRVTGGEPEEITLAELLASIPAGDALVLNDTKVLKRRVFAGDLEILFLSPVAGFDRRWQVLFPSKKFPVGSVIGLPGGRRMTLVQKGRPQIVEVDAELDESYFERAAELPLPPYIQKARHERHNVPSDDRWYQTAWAARPGSFAAPTASLHFSAGDLRDLRERGVEIHTITLHVGLGTFLPVTAEDLDRHEMHSEWAEIPPGVARAVRRAQERGAGVWALGTTVTRTLESAALGKLAGDWDQGFQGFTDLLIQPGHEWRVVNRLLTNFHQPKSTLLALVAAFAGLPAVKACYPWAIRRKFRLFSYGDLSVWTR
ncbi:MAG: S-adenosylmethionine:tRNA ribosyltransferase-isomerase [Bdellovibrionaceae bacterium]|nr:S-adenosylmethionine:tRNA ribosyltransferase-isomerase [Pseudobdellovibrionaceae bacterium]MBX3033873.1 S-adenosylmethionine:tRNA ribosyltransferase-isomerase [Pseudobdellovibrionaceae bacterium]